MTKRILSFFLLAAFLLSLCGCGGKNVSYSNPIDFYFLDAEEQFGAQTGALAQETVDLLTNDVQIQQILDRYLKGPTEDGLRSPFPAGLKAEVESLQDGELDIRLSSEFDALSGVSLTLAAACLTMTLTQISGVDSVMLETGSGVLSQQANEAYSARRFLFYDELASHPEQQVSLYFYSDKGSLEAERRSIPYREGENIAVTTFETLLNGSSQERYSSGIPEGTELLDLTITDGLCKLVLSEDFADCDTGILKARHAVRSVVASLCSLSGIESVQITLVDGSTLSYYDISEPLVPDATWFK